ncbi:MAG: prolyl oligopeptidase family serine peptidase [Planctomycetaceae bacterium]|jgi:dipeptidyl aminopeptidase/acylaminoacyl peptidase
MFATRLTPAWFLLALLPLVVFAQAPPPSASPGPSDPLRPPAIATESVPPVERAVVDRLRQYQAVRTASFLGWHPAGTGMFITTRFGDTAQVHFVAAPGASREQRTFLAEPVTARPIPGRADGSLVLSYSVGGSENDQFFLLPAGRGLPRRITDGKSRHLGGPFDPRGERMIIHGNQRNPRDTDLYIATLGDRPTLELLLPVEQEHWTAQDWSRDGRELLLNKYVSITESQPALFDIASRQLTPLTLPDRVPAACAPMRFGADGRTVWMATDTRGEFRELARLDRQAGTWDWVSADIPWDVAELELDRAGGRVAFTTNTDGASALYIIERGQRRQLPLPLGTVAGLEFHPDGRQLGFTLARPDAPADAFAIDLATGRLTQWTFSEAGGLDPRQFVAPRLVRFPSFDGREIPAYYFAPKGASPTRRVPVLINIHGGPESQYRPSFQGTDQFYCHELGIAVLHPNVRGSAGYGRTYLGLDNGPLREDSVKDIGALLDWIARQPELDPERVAVMGGSYGGYMVLASLTHYPDRLRAGVDVVGIASFRSFLKNTSSYRQDLRRAEYGDERDPAMQEFFARIDPLANADRIRSRLLVAHGRNDPRVPFSEASQMAARVRELGQPVWTVYADNEGHGFAKKPNRDYLTAVVVQFLAEAFGLPTPTNEPAPPANP